MNRKTELFVKNLDWLLNQDLRIPIYQRPYEWARANVLTLLNDIYEEYKKNKDINLGTIILFSDKKKLDIVDGQQRIITLSLLYCGLGIENKILKSMVQCVSNTEKNIRLNYNEIKAFIIRLKKNDDFDINDFKKYIRKRIVFFVMKTYDEEESFQLFDGRNSKFKNLDPVDLLKAYHLGVITKKSEKKEAINLWNKHINAHFDDINKTKNKIQFLFDDVLFNIYNWSLNKDRRTFEKEDIYLYKGYKEDFRYNYVNYYSAKNSETFLINKPFKEGISFFIMVNKYINKYDEIIKDHNMYEMLKEKIKFEKYKYSKEDFNSQYYYILIYYYDALFFFKNKFKNKENYEFDIINDYLKRSALIHRINQKQVNYSSLNKYIIENSNFFYECNNALSINELYKLELDEVIPPDKYKNPSGLNGTRSEIWEKYML